MKTYLKYICPLFSLLVLAILVQFRSLPSGKLWNEYNVIYTSVDTSDFAIIETLENNDIYDYICLSNQYLPVISSENSPELSLYRLNSSEERFSYVNKRNSYFFDKSQKYKLYYIPVSQKEKLNNCINQLGKQGINVGIDSTSSFPWILPAVIFALSIFFLFLTKNTRLFILAAISPNVFVFCNPFYPVAISEALILLSIFFIANIWKRKGAKACILKQKFVILNLILAIVSNFACSFTTGFLGLFVIFATISFIYTYYLAEETSLKDASFIPVLIISAKKTSIFAKHFKQVMTTISLSLMLIFVSFGITSSSSSKSRFTKLLLPCDTQIESSDLGQFKDFYDFTWNFTKLPYENLNFNNSETEYSFPRFIEEDGIIKERIYTVEYNQLFKDSVYSNIDNLQFNSIEKVMKSQSKNFKGGYSSVSSARTSNFGLICMGFGFLMLLFIYISVIINKGEEK